MFFESRLSKFGEAPLPNSANAMRSARGRRGQERPTSPSRHKPHFAELELLSVAELPPVSNFHNTLLLAVRHCSGSKVSQKRTITPSMALIQTSLTWVAYAVCLGILGLFAAVFVFIYQKPSERSIAVTAVCWLTTLSLLATVLLLPVDVALTSSTTDRKLGRKKEWATQNKVDDIKFQLEVVYYLLYSLDAVLCLLVVPFTYFWYEEYDQVDSEEGNQTLAGRLWGAFKYTLGFVVICLILFLVGFFIPVAKKAMDEHRDLDYFKYLLTENRESTRKGTLNGTLIFDRRRASSDILSRRTDRYWHNTLLPLHGTRPSASSGNAHQICPSHFGTSARCLNLQPTRPKSRTPTPTGRTQRRSRRWFGRPRSPRTRSSRP